MECFFFVLFNHFARIWVWCTDVFTYIWVPILLNYWVRQAICPFRSPVYWRRWNQLIGYFHSKIWEYSLLARLDGIKTRTVCKQTLFPRDRTMLFHSQFIVVIGLFWLCVRLLHDTLTDLIRLKPEWIFEFKFNCTPFTRMFISPIVFHSRNFTKAITTCGLHLETVGCLWCGETFHVSIIIDSENSHQIWIGIHWPCN